MSSQNKQCLACQRTGGTILFLVGLQLFIKGKFSSNVIGKNRFAYMAAGTAVAVGGIYYGWIDTYFEEVSFYYV